ncbi:phosphoribosylanthranilate isomerase [Sporomusa sphaeroides]|uniref:phosphoribosylanthranilate isomerase n=1 Tax=Sporomusa sphaeroides TaxID=47679 RepID=UPI001E4C3886|nr:phosphoribosylanthranilate isomerase [Sporomusa sphaeroides]
MAAYDFGADWIGFVFAPSKRRITLAEARKISCRISQIGKVGVFVNAPLTEVREAASACKLDYVQLHGDEPPEYCRLVGYPVIKAFRIGSGFSATAFNGYRTSWTLFDSFTAGVQGGTGRVFDWQAAQTLVKQAPRPLLAAGGLTPENVTQAIAVLGPDGVDVSGGVETNGIKDIEKIKRFITAAKGGIGQNAK